MALSGAELLNVDGTEADVTNRPVRLPNPKISFEPNVAEKGTLCPEVRITGYGTQFTKGVPTLTFSNTGITTTNLKVLDDTHMTVALDVAATAESGNSDAKVVMKSPTGVLQIAPGSDVFSVRGDEDLAVIEPFNDSTSLVKIKPPRSFFCCANSEPEVVVIGSRVFGLRDAPFYKRSDDEIEVLAGNDLLRTNHQVLWKRLLSSCAECSKTYQIPFVSGTGVTDFAITGITLVSYSPGSPNSGPSGSLSKSNVVVSTRSETANGTALFTVGDGTPAVTSFSEVNGQPGETFQQVIITGAFTHFTRSTPTITFSDPGVVATNVAAIDDTHLRADIRIAGSALKGQGNVTVETGPEIAIGSGLFGIGSGTALIANISPPTADRDAPPFVVGLSGNGTHFVQGQSTLKFSNSGIAASGVTVIDATHLTATLTVAANAAAGSSNVIVTTGAETAFGTGIFTVAPATPVITMVSPASGQQGQTLKDVLVTGKFTTFKQSRPSVIFSNPGITASNVQVIDNTRLAVTLNISPTAGSAASVAADSLGPSQKATNTYAITGSRLSDLSILVPPGIPVEHYAQTLVTFSLSDDQAKAFKSIVVRHGMDQPVIVILPAPPTTSSTAPPKPSIKAQSGTGVAVGTSSLTVSGTGMSQVISVRYLETPLAFTSSSDTALTIQQLPTLAPPGIEVVFVYADKSMTPYFIPVQTPGPK